MQFTKSETSLIKQRLKSPKLLLYIVAALALAMDVFFIMFLTVAGMRTEIWGLLILMAALDLLPFPVIYHSNFRFKYSRRRLWTR